MSFGKLGQLWYYSVTLVKGKVGGAAYFQARYLRRSVSTGVARVVFQVRRQASSGELQ